MSIYETELQNLKPWDEVQFTQHPIPATKGFNFIITAGHGYLVIPKENPYYNKLNASKYSFKGENALYLEEDSEAPAFLKTIN